MTRLTPPSLYLENLKGNIKQLQRGYIPKEKAYNLLKECTGKDFGYNTNAWEWYLWKGKIRQDIIRLFKRK